MSDFSKNKEVVKTLTPVSMSKDRLEETFNKTISEGYISNPTNDRFVVTQKNPRGNVTFPLILISSLLETTEFKTAIIEALDKVPQVGDDVAVMYKHGKTATFLCNTKGNKDSIRILKSFCLNFKYYVAKGKVKKDLEFDELLDMNDIGKEIIIDEEQAVEYIPEVKQVEEKIVGCEKYQKEIESILKAGRSISEIDRLVNPEKSSVEIKEKTIIPTPIPAPIPQSKVPIIDNKTENLHSNEEIPVPKELQQEVKAW